MQDMTGDYYVLIMGYRYVPGDESLLSRLRNNKGGHFLLFGSKPTVEEREHRMGVTIQMELFQPVPGMEGKEERIVQFLAKSRPHGLKMSYLKKLPDVDLRNLETLFRERVLYMLGDTCYLNPNVSIKFTEEESAEFSDTLMKVILDTVSSKRERLSLEDFRLCCRLFRQLPCKTHTVALLSQLYVCVGNTEDIYSERLKGLYVKLFERFKNENQGQMYVLGDSLREFVSFFKKSGDMVGDLKEYRLILFEVTRQPSWSVALDMKNKRYDRVIETSTMLIELFSYYGKEFEKPIAEYYCLRGKAFRSLKKYDEAVSDFSQAISLQPKNAEFWNERGNTFYKFNQYQDSISDFSQAISLCASDARYWYNRGYSLYCLGKYEEAISDNKKAIYISPDFAPAWGQLGCAFMELGNKKEAIEAFSKSIDLNPDDINVRLARGLTLHNLKQYKEAILDLIQVVSFQPDCVKAWSYLGYCLLSLKEYEEASFKFSQAISFNPNDFKNWYMRAVCYFRMKRYREAISDFSQTLILNPREEMAYYNRSICYKALGDEESLKKAQEDYEIYLKLEQSNNF